MHFPAQDPQCSGSVSPSTHTPLQLDRPVGQAQAPATHVKPGEHDRPQPPQSAGLVERSTQPPPQRLAGGVHPPALHEPFSHASVAKQWLPQEPQFAALARRSTHSPSHSERPAGHVHRPALQICPLWHAVSHPPQCAESEVTSMHAPAHATKPGAHESAQVPLLQTWPAPHAPPQAPQFRGSLATVTHSSPQVR